MASRIAVMDRGQVQQFASPDEVYNRPANLFVARFIGTPPMNTVRATLAADGGGLVARVGGASLPLPPQPEAVRAYVGREVFLGIRPECISDRAGPAHIEGEVEMSEPTGAETVVLLKVAGERLRAKLAPDARPAIGAKAVFSVDTRTVCLFDPQTEKRIA